MPKHFSTASGCPDPYSHTLSVNYSTSTITKEDGATFSWVVDSSGNRTSITLPSDSYHGTQAEHWTPET